MKLTCCIIENEPVCILYLSKLLQQWASETKCELLIDSTVSKRDFDKQNPLAYDILFIDIVLDEKEDGQNGIDIAREIRATSYTGELVFLTNFQDYVFEGYPVQALDYLIKPASYEKICHCMNQVLEKLTGKYFIYRTKDSILQIPYQNILYFSSSNHSAEIITKQKQYRIPQTLKNILKILPAQFAQCHRTLIVNMYHIESMSNREIFLSNQELLPISQTYLVSLRKNLLTLVKNRRKA